MKRTIAIAATVIATLSLGACASKTNSTTTPNTPVPNAFTVPTTTPDLTGIYVTTDEILATQKGQDLQAKFCPVYWEASAQGASDARMEEAFASGYDPKTISVQGHVPTAQEMFDALVAAC